MFTQKLLLTAVSTAVLTAVLTAGLLAACGGGNDVTHLLNSARSALDKGDTASAIIELKNVLQKQPGTAEARFLLGKAFLDDGDGSSALVEFRKAAGLEFPAQQVQPMIARAQLAAREFKPLVAEFSATGFQDLTALADLKSSLAMAYQALGDRPRADAALQAALTARPGFAPAVSVQIRSKASEGNFAEALRLSDELLKREPMLAEVWRLKGDVLMASRSHAADAVAAYEQALKLRPKELAAHVGLLQHWLQVDDLAAATAQLARFKAATPNNLQTRSYEAMLAYKREDYKAARELMPQLLKVAPENPQLLQLAGAIEFELKSYAQAEAWSSKALSLAPGLIPARQTLVKTYLLTGRPAKAALVVQPLLQGGRADATTYSMAGRAALQSGETKQAEDYFAKAVKLNPADARSRASLALGRSSRTEPADVQQELAAISSSDAGSVADIALIRSLLQRRELDKALAAIDVLERKQPKKPVAANLRGLIQLSRSDVLGARQSFERALAVDPSFYPSAALLANLDLADKRPAAAQRRFDDLLKADPGNVQARLALVELREQAHAPKEEVAAMIGKAIAAKPTAALAHMAMIEHQLKHRDLKAAQAAAQQALLVLPGDPRIIETQGRVQMLAGDHNQALDSFKHLARLLPQSALPELRLAEAYAAQKNTKAAIHHLKRALLLAPHDLAAQRSLAELYLLAGDFKEALVLAQQIQKQHVNLALGHTLEGNVLATQKSWPAAATSFRLSLEKAADSAVAIKLHTCLLAGTGKADAEAEAEKFAAGWIKEHPADLAFLYYLGVHALTHGEFDLAETRFAALLKLQPAHAQALNNQAWLLLKLNQPGALALAEKANEVMPNQPAVLDTLSMALEAQKMLPRAIEVQRRAVDLQPQAHDRRMRLAKLYLKSGDKPMARAELQQLAKAGRDYAGQVEVQDLFKQL